MSTNIVIKIKETTHSFTLEEAKELYDKLHEVFGVKIPNSAPIQPYNPWTPYGPVKIPEPMPYYPWWEVKPQDLPIYMPQVICQSTNWAPPNQA